MNLESDRQQNVQMELDFSATSAGEAREAGREETESLAVAHGPESPASTNRLMEEVCERENLREAWRRVKANKGAPNDVVRRLIEEELAKVAGPAAARKLRAFYELPRVLQ